MIAPSPGPALPITPGRRRRPAAQVDRDTVLQARAALLTEALRLRDAVRGGSANLGVRLCGGDPVSPDAAKAFNERVDALYDECRRYAADLERAGEMLGDVARTYGYSESEIAASFNA